MCIPIGSNHRGRGGGKKGGGKDIMPAEIRLALRLSIYSALS